MREFIKNIINSSKYNELNRSVFWERSISYHEYDFLKSYLYAVFTNSFKDDNLYVSRCIAHSSLSHKPQRPAVLDSGNQTFKIIGDGVLEVTATWLEEDYEIVVSRAMLYNDQLVHTIFCLGLTGNASHPKDLVEYCFSQALANSYYNNSVLKITYHKDERGGIGVEPVEVTGRPLSDIFLPVSCIEAIETFTEVVKKYSDIQQPLKYLLCGKPGTGKTEPIRSIIESTKGLATIMLAESVSDFNEVFDFASKFSPAILCFDDVDLLCGDRHQNGFNGRLGQFLTLMDGIKASNTFVLATTNDKSWVDAAASRPGRFDMVLDMNLIDPVLYPNLISRRCRNQQIIDLFDETVLYTLKNQKASGAFVVNLIKQLEIKNALTPGLLTPDYIIDMIQKMHKGFYKQLKENECNVGFESN